MENDNLKLFWISGVCITWAVSTACGAGGIVSASIDGAQQGNEKQDNKFVHFDCFLDCIIQYVLYTAYNFSVFRFYF
jgi:hypothetical protein